VTAAPKVDESGVHSFAEIATALREAVEIGRRELFHERCRAAGSVNEIEIRDGEPAKMLQLIQQQGAVQIRRLLVGQERHQAGLHFTGDRRLGHDGERVSGCRH